MSAGEVRQDAVRGQYAGGEVDGKRVPAYRSEDKVARDSHVETYAAIKLHIDNMRWAGVPFYLRSGKRMSRRSTEIVIEFKPAAHTPFGSRASHGAPAQPNRLVATVSPHEGIVLEVLGKLPGQEMLLQSIDLPYCYTEATSGEEPASAYEHLLLDAVNGDPTFFARADEVEASWAAVDPVIARWTADGADGLPSYPAGSAGPPAAEDLLARDGRRWHSSRP